MSTQQNFTLGRYTEIGAFSTMVRSAIKRTNLVAMGLLACEVAYLFLTDQPGALAFGLIGGGTCLALAIWCSACKGLPLLPLMVLQNLIIYGLPIVFGHSVLQLYPDSFVLKGGLEVFVMDLSMALVWKGGMQLFTPSPPVSYALRELNKSGTKGWSRLGFAMVILSTTSQLLGNFGYLDWLFALVPSGSSSIFNALNLVMSASGFFLVALAVGSGHTSAAGKAFFWILLVANGMVASSDFILADVAATIVTVAIGLFWSSGRFPWLFLIVSLFTLSFFNGGKTAMRIRYWGTDVSYSAQLTLKQLPSVYGEWVETSFDSFTQGSADPAASKRANSEPKAKNQTIFDRLDNLQNLLFVIDATETDHVPLLYGKTYSIIPPLLVPRILWPDKPRSHEGQVILNVHFGRQDLNSTFTTYIAWGLLPEAYGNFGPIAGSILLGGLLGGIFAWIENFTARKLVISIEGFLSLSLLMSLMNSFEMVASVFITAVFQSFVIIIAASLPFVQRTVTHKPETEEQ